ncbi:unnamed protein product, partial [Polarella glacialis]
ADLQRVADYGFNSFRFSISWPRIFPKGLDGVHRPNPEGVQFYMHVLDSLKAKNIIPLVTIFHWDLPDDLDWLDVSVVESFAEYADFLFRTFPEVKHWITMNEPWSFCYFGYKLGVHAPGIKSNHSDLTCAHHALLAHARAVEIYRKQYQKAAGGIISIVLNTDFGFPQDSTSAADIQATQLYHDFNIGWFADPIYLTGDYPASMRERLGDLLPRFTAQQSALVRGSFDFYGLNTYAGKYINSSKTSEEGWQECNGTDGKPIGPKADSEWLLVVPRALRAYLEYVTTKYNPGAIIITENGVDVPGEDEMPMTKALNDQFRVDYFRTYLDQMALAVKLSGAPVTGYFAWALLDNFEWADGYSKRFGITYVNYKTQERFPKASAKWWMGLMRRLASAKDGPYASHAYNSDTELGLQSSASETPRPYYDVHRPDNASLQCLKPEAAGCGSIRNKSACLSSLDGRKGLVEHGLKVGGEPCVWCGGMSCTSFSNSLCEPYDWLINGQGSAYNRFYALGIFNVARCPNVTQMQAPAVITDGSVLVPQPNSMSPGSQIGIGASIGVLLVAGVALMSSWNAQKQFRTHAIGATSDCSSSETDA